MRICEATRHPTILRENASMMKHTYAVCAHVDTNVRSVTHKRFGRSAVKSRSTRSAGRRASSSGTVVRTFRLRDTPRIPSCPMRRATWSRPITWPARWAAFHSLCAPYTL